MFTLSKQLAKVAHINLREEKHGDDDVLAADIKLTAAVSNAFLDQLAPGLRAALYTTASGGSEDLALEDNPHLVQIRFPLLRGLKWEETMEGGGLIIHGAKKSDDLGFTADINSLRLDCKDGGTVELTFRAQILPEASEVGSLTAFLGHEAKISVRLPIAPDMDAE